MCWRISKSGPRMMNNRPTNATPSQHDLRCDIMRCTRRSCFIWVAYTRNEASGRVGGGAAERGSEQNGVREKKITGFLATRGLELIPAKFNSARNNFTAIGVVAIATTGGSPVNSSRVCHQFGVWTAIRTDWRGEEV
jgi:hypothetical protein